MSKDFYEVLGVDAQAPANDIKRAYKKLARENHPDRNQGDSAAEERFKEVTRAHEVLSDPERRKVYDELGMEAEAINWDPKQASTYRQWAGGRGAGTGRGDEAYAGPDLGSIFGDLFGGGGFGGGGFGGARPSGPSRGPDIRTKLAIRFEDAVLGAERRISLDRPGAAVPCAACRGTGQVRVAQAGLQLQVPCPTCDGSGQVLGPAERTTLDVKVPKGVATGQTIRLKGQGGPGLRGGVTGDLLIELSVGEHEHYRRDGRDLHLDVPVTVGEAVQGGPVEIPTLEGKRVRLNVPPGVRRGQKMRLGGKGVPAAGGKPAGDLYVHLLVEVPEAAADDAAVAEALKTIEAAYTRSVRAHFE